MSVRRTFIAIDISETAREAITEYIKRLLSDLPRVNISWERPEKLHFTIRFLGDTAEDGLERVCQIAKSVAREFTPFEVRITETGVFPHPKSPRILWLGARQGSDEMVKLNLDIEARLQAAGFPREKRPFHPHLTIGRVRDQLRSRELVRTHKQRQLEPIMFIATSLTLYESKLEKAGSVYSAIRLFPFSH